MERFFVFDEKNTFYDWGLILTSKDITPPEPKTNYVTLDGRSGSLDLSDVLTGEIAYNDRTITATFWTSEGSRKDREKIIRDMTSYLHGKKVKIQEPDDTDHYFYGRVKITSYLNNLSYAEISIECVCDPWRYATDEYVRTVGSNSDSITNVVINTEGVKTLSPIFTVFGEIVIIYNGKAYTLTDGSYRIPDVKLSQGVNIIGVRGIGSVTIAYREAEL